MQNNRKYSIDQYIPSANLLARSPCPLAISIYTQCVRNFGFRNDFCSLDNQNQG